MAMQYILYLQTGENFRLKVYDHIAEKDSSAENCIAICTSKDT